LSRRAASTSGRDRALLIVFIHTGAHLLEIAKPELEREDAPDIDLDDQLIRVTGTERVLVLLVSIAPRSGL
jgi:hypothetical protein